MPRSTNPGAPDERASVRFDTHLPVQVQGCPGHAHNISAHGIFFESDVQQRLGALVDVAVEFTLYGRRHRLHCEGKVVRIERRGGRIGVGARLLAPFFEAIEHVAPAPARKP